MSMGARLSLWGLYNMNNDLFSSFVFPDDFTSDDQDVLIQNLLIECAELEVLYADADWMEAFIGVWSAKEVTVWNRLFAAQSITYNPIENYNRVEDTNIQNRGAMTHSGNDSVVGTGNDSDVYTGTDTDTHSITSFDSNTYQAKEKHDFLNGKTITHNHGITDTTNYGHIVTDTTGSHTLSNISGNIGVTTSQQMLESEVELAPKLNVINYIIESFKNRFCLLVY